MAEVFTFSEDGMRKLVEMYRAQQREMSNLKRHLAHFSTRRHPTVYLPQTGGAKLVKFTTLPAAYGGQRAGITGSAAESNGNTNPTELKYYPRYVSVYEYDSTTGGIVDTGEDIWAVNLGSLPLTEGWGLAHKWMTDPDYGDLWVVNTDMSVSHYGAASFDWQTSFSGSPFTWILNSGDEKLIRANTGLGLINPNSRCWAFAKDSDVFLTHMGRWEVTFGFEGYLNSIAYVETNHTTGTYSGTPSHDHTYTQQHNVGGFVVVGVHRNFQSGTSVVGTNPNTLHNINVYVPGRHTSSSNRNVQHEKTIMVHSEREPWHGQHHTRLSIFATFNSDYYDNNGGSDPTFSFTKFWMRVKPAMGTDWANNNGNQDYMGAGANQYPLDDYSSAASGSGTFVWWGGGDEPPSLDEDGAEV